MLTISFQMIRGAGGAEFRFACAATDASTGSHPRRRKGWMEISGEMGRGWGGGTGEGLGMGSSLMNLKFA